MQGQPAASEGRHQLPHLLVLQGSVGNDDQNHRRGKGTHGPEMEPPLEHQIAQADAPGKAGGKLILIGQGQPSRPDAPHHQGQGVGDKGRRHQKIGVLPRLLAFQGKEHKKQDHGRRIQPKGGIEEDFLHQQEIHFVPSLIFSASFSRNSRLPFRLRP